MYGFNEHDDFEEDPQEWLDTISEMIDSGQYDWAFDTLIGIGETIEQRQKVTDNQVQAIINIKTARRL